MIVVHCPDCGSQIQPGGYEYWGVCPKCGRLFIEPNRLAVRADYVWERDLTNA